MSKVKKERRCKKCGKLLIDEKLPFCRRCVLEGRNTAGMVGGIGGGLITIIALAAEHMNNKSNMDNQV